MKPELDELDIYIRDTQGIEYYGDIQKVKYTRAAEMQGGMWKHKIMNMTEIEVYEYINKLKLDSYQEGYSECLRKDVN